MSIIKRNGLLFQSSLEYDEDIMIESDRLEEYCNYIKENRCKAVSLLYPFTESNIDFLSDFPWIEHVNINSSYVLNVNVINHLPNLKTALINTSSLTLDSPSIENISFDWTKKTVIKDSCLALKKIKVHNCKDFDVFIKNISKLPGLMELILVKPKTDTLEFCKQLKHITNLEVYYGTSLYNISGIVNLKETLRYLWIENCKKILDVFILSELKKLERLTIANCGEIKSLQFLKEMPMLSDIRFLGTNIIDGDLSPCKGYDYVACDNKKHYNYLAADLMRVL